ncbi:MAG: UbiD family decarboxylase [Chloroflexi bacterium]|nr:UbiD family decarboxylase [Chloroflexota bacterium]
MPYDDLRGFLAALTDADEVRTVRGADWDLELGTIDELNYERRGPALLFDEIGSYPGGFRVLTNTTATKRRASIALGFDPDMPEEEALTRIEEMLKSARPVPPVEVTTGPLMQNVFTGQDIDLLKFPTPRWHENDGGRYLGTGCCVILRDPDTGQVNYGAYRVMVHDANTTGLYITPSHVGAVIRRKYWQRGQSAPVAVSFGQDPIWTGPYRLSDRHPGPDGEGRHAQVRSCRSHPRGAGRSDSRAGDGPARSCQQRDRDCRRVPAAGR